MIVIDYLFCRSCKGTSSKACIRALICTLCWLQLLTTSLTTVAEDAHASLDAKAGSEWVASVRWENDIFGGTDRYYTVGTILEMTKTGPSWLDPIADLLPWSTGNRTVGYDLTQTIFTPATTDLTIPNPADRPYAGIIALGLSLQVTRGNSYNGLKLSAGLVGPWAMAEQTQRYVHALFGRGSPNGWDYQLDNEAILNLSYEYRHKFLLVGTRDGWSLEGLPWAGGMLGNALIQGQLGGMLRIDYNRPNDFGVLLERGLGQMPIPWWPPDAGTRSGWGCSIYGGFLVNLVGRDITLDGNTFTDSPSVDKRLFVPAAGFGMAVGSASFQTSFTYLVWGKEFKGQDGYSKIGAITFSYLF